ncbi:uncharacterized protein [Euphorbia lathyris]|uniref:uncharacterized protein isoform X2 n=1 Tax=Euphorbia lathyris TaxID=212925 RepID=UPI0033138C31
MRKKVWTRARGPTGSEGKRFERVKCPRRPESLVVEDAHSIIVADDLPSISVVYRLGEPYELAALNEETRAHHAGCVNELIIYEEQLESGMRLPLLPFFVEVLKEYDLCPGQIHPNGWRMMVAFYSLCRSAGYRATGLVFREFFKPSKGQRSQHVTFSHQKFRVMGGLKDKLSEYRHRFFLVRKRDGEFPFRVVWNDDPMDSNRWLKTRPMLPFEENLVTYLKGLPTDKDHKQDVDELVRHFLAAGYYIWNKWRMADIRGWSAPDFEKWKKGYNFKVGELAELEAISVNVAIVGPGDPRVSMDFDPNEFSVGLETADEAFGGASGSLVSYSSLEDANQVVQSMGGVLAAWEGADGEVDVPQGKPVTDSAAQEPAGGVEMIALDEEVVGSPSRGMVARKRKRDNGKTVVKDVGGERNAEEVIAGAGESGEKPSSDGANWMSSDVTDRIRDHPEMVKRMEMKISKFKDYVMDLSVHSDMMSSDLARAMARVARVPGEQQRMDGVSKMNLGLETLSALGVAIQNATRVFDMCVNDENAFRDMEAGLRRSVNDLEEANQKLTTVRELLDRREAEITVLSEAEGRISRSGGTLAAFEARCRGDLCVSGVAKDGRWVDSPCSRDYEGEDGTRGRAGRGERVSQATTGGCTQRSCRSSRSGRPTRGKTSKIRPHDANHLSSFRGVQCASGGDFFSEHL